MPSIRDKVRARVQEFLEPGEQIQAVIAGQTLSPAWAVFTFWLLVFKPVYRWIVVTDRRIVVFARGRSGAMTSLTVVSTVPRTTTIGPPTGLLWFKTSNLGERIWVPKAFFKDVKAADAAA